MTNPWCHGTPLPYLWARIGYLDLWRRAPELWLISDAHRIINQFHQPTLLNFIKYWSGPIFLCDFSHHIAPSWRKTLPRCLITCPFQDVQCWSHCNSTDQETNWFEAEEATHLACKPTTKQLVVIHRLYNGAARVKTLEVAQRKEKSVLEDYQLVSKDVLSNQKNSLFWTDWRHPHSGLPQCPEFGI